ncbi:16S rRNA (guanine(527)-N(7))-methyltransferase RsmG [Rhodobacteraceae bacterium 10Alg 79]|uniref:Ribosomal RNA small subunit methyltransferase G n=1 Tax=Rhodalgimonas zhirmunskyi TaxID=2964767 RepID=A0AAJ1UDX8_9RHOB|nr:16S rRNA (guanine(527)-N(7))-methyltransferase RsmG [Rhodoalgimonas zhirmunskyi]MDQ2094307.1 16S rRNA (guanine(527)-N(7))-methyltransferase RsmG [Rhodoalgimonas zhirmunskyi]
MTPNAEALNVSRETFRKLEQFAALLEKWNPRINLVARSTLGDLWTRHIIDSLQVLENAPRPVSHWVDLGSGGGFPGLVAALCASDFGIEKVTLVESDQRKCTFLRTVLRETGSNASVIAERIESIDPLDATVLSARALAELETLLGFAERHLAEGGVALFPKGKNWREEVQTARAVWDFRYDALPSKTDQQAVILKIEGLSRV